MAEKWTPKLRSEQSEGNSAEQPIPIPSRRRILSPSEEGAILKLIVHIDDNSPVVLTKADLGNERSDETMKNLEYLQTLGKIRIYQNDKSETVIVEITREGREMARKARKKSITKT